MSTKKFARLPLLIITLIYSTIFSYVIVPFSVIRMAFSDLINSFLKPTKTCSSQLCQSNHNSLNIEDITIAKSIEAGFEGWWQLVLAVFFYGENSDNLNDTQSFVPGVQERTIIRMSVIFSAGSICFRIVPFWINFMRESYGNDFYTFLVFKRFISITHSVCLIFMAFVWTIIPVGLLSFVILTIV